MLAAQAGHLEVVKVLVEFGRADIAKKDKLARTALIHAAKNGHLPCVSYLVHMSADPNTCDSSKNTAVHYAAAFGFPAVVKYLIDCGADPNAFNNVCFAPTTWSALKTNHPPYLVENHPVSDMHAKGSLRLC